MINHYLKRKTQYLDEYRQLDKKYNLISNARFVCVCTFLFSLYKYVSGRDNLYLYLGIAVLIGFIILITLHRKISWNRRLQKEFTDINSEEIGYLSGKNILFKDGTEYSDFNHFYSYDLDFFGKNSFFHNLNRTATFIGSKRLSQLFLSNLPNNKILANQEAIKELTPKIDWRQQLYSIARITNDSEQEYQNLIQWAESEQRSVSRIVSLLTYITPLLFIGFLIAYAFTDKLGFRYASIGIFIFNVGVLMTQYNNIKKEILSNDKIHETIKKYGLIIEQIENEQFQSQKLKKLKNHLNSESGLGSLELNKLSSLFQNLENIENGIAAAIINGVSLHHISVLNKLLKWKSQYAQRIKNTLDIIGEFEALNSIANFAYNNPTYNYPTLNTDHEIYFKQLGHPLINADQRVDNDIDFNTHKFIILTGSNMSGKSTFLRTVGVNMVLAGIGAPVCAIKANVHPLKVLVSMRQSDSLNQGESYFFAEVKRLKKIMNALESETCFVLLDEILRGTNSEDKQAGTVEVIKKMIGSKAIGIIATHDLNVCNTTNDYPNYLQNKCFEADLMENDLSFDYKLKDGICKNKSATFIMKKMEII